jgi:kinesin family protein 2/24
MIAAVSPSVASVEHTLNTLRYADRVKEMKEAGSSRKARHNAYMPHNDENNSSKRNSSQTSSSSRTTRPRSVSPRASKHHNRAVTSISFKNAQKTKSIKAPTSYRGHLRAPTATANLRSRTVKSPKHNRHRSAAPAKSGKSRSIPSIPRISPSDSPSRSFRKEKSFDGSTSSSSNNNNRNNDNNNGNGNGLLKLLEKQNELKTQNKKAQSDILSQHRKHIHSTMMRVKQNMELLKSFEGNKMDVKDYLSSMRDLLSQAVQSANHLTSNVENHERSLMEEGTISVYNSSV